VRKIAVSMVSGLSVVVLTVGLAPGVSAEPTIDQVTAQLDSMSRKNERLTELYNGATEVVKTKRAAAAGAKLALVRARAAYDVSRVQLRSTLADSFTTSAMSRTTALLTSTSRQNYLDQVSALQLLASRRSAITVQLKGARTTADSAQKTAIALLADAARKQKALGEQRTKLVADQDKYQKLLARLTAEERARFFAKANPTPSPAATAVAVTQSKVAAPSGAAGAAVAFALAQQGKPYSFAAAGPGAFDCSGLTMAAWAAAGVSLPHFAETQYNYGTHVSRDQLKPGDLVFFYQPIGHVAMYIGNGLIVHAPTEGDVVRVVPLDTFASDYVGATRL
jgi:cell wall-associated NlpC family hydrolase